MKAKKKKKSLRKIIEETKDIQMKRKKLLTVRNKVYKQNNAFLTGFQNTKIIMSLCHQLHSKATKHPPTSD